MTAVFGLPAVHEDDGLRGIRAAGDVSARLTEFAAELSADPRIAIEFRVGISTGRVVTGGASRAAAASDRRAADAIGSPWRSRGSEKFSSTTRRGGSFARQWPASARTTRGACLRRSGAVPRPLVSSRRWSVAIAIDVACTMRSTRRSATGRASSSPCSARQASASPGLSRSSCRSSAAKSSSQVVAASPTETESRTGRCSRPSKRLSA